MKNKKPIHSHSSIPSATKPRIIIMSGYGLNCEEETKFAFESVGGSADIVHINDFGLPNSSFSGRIFLWR